MGKRGNGEGTIYFSESKKLWVGQFVNGFKDNGKLNRKTVYGKTRKEVKDKITKGLAEVQSNNYVEKSNITLIELINRILQNKINANLIQEATRKRTLDTIKIIDESEIANIELQKLTSQQVQNFLNSKTMYADSVIAKIYIQINTAIKEAIHKSIINKNIMNDVIKPKSQKQKKEIDSLTVAEQKAFIISVENDEYYKNILLLCLHSGMRVGEVLALTLEDVDFENKKIKINKTLTKNINDETIIGKTTKTYNSMRDIPITTVLEPILRDSIYKYISNENNLLFCHYDGSIIAPSTINIHFKKICKNSNIRVKTVKKKKGYNEDNEAIYVNYKTSTVNTHMLRHTYATRCIESGVPAPVLQKLLGHKDISTTLNTYTTIFNKFTEDSLNNYINYINNI